MEKIKNFAKTILRAYVNGFRESAQMTYGYLY